MTPVYIEKVAQRLDREMKQDLGQFVNVAHDTKSLFPFEQLKMEWQSLFICRAGRKVDLLRSGEDDNMTNGRTSFSSYAMKQQGLCICDPNRKNLGNLLVNKRRN